MLKVQQPPFIHAQDTIASVDKANKSFHLDAGQWTPVMGAEGKIPLEAIFAAQGKGRYAGKETVPLPGVGRPALIRGLLTGVKREKDALSRLQLDIVSIDFGGSSKSTTSAVKGKFVYSYAITNN
jgi:hypothetical protein